MSTNFRASAGVVNEDLEAFLSDKPHTIVMRNVRYGSSQKAYSPDGRYYLKRGAFYRPDKPNCDTCMEGSSVIYDAVTNERVAEAYKRGYDAYPLVWAADSSGMYVRFAPRMSMGQYLNHFMYKLLVPGAVKQEPPVFTTVPFGESSQPDASAFVAIRSKNNNSVLYRTMMQTGGDSGWYIDDLLVKEAPFTPIYLR